MAELAVNGGSRIREHPFPSWPRWDERERHNLLEVLETGKWWYGDKVKLFEEQFAAYQDAKFGVTFTSGTTALHGSLVAAGVTRGDEVILPPFTFVATAAAVMLANGTPVFVDIDADTFNIDANKIESAITPRTKAIIPVHFAGLPADMDRIGEIAARHRLRVVEDAAHAWGSEWRGTKVGALGDFGCFSFQASKNITAGEGGIALTNDEELADRCRSFSNCGRGKGRPWYEHHILGSNYRLTEFQAAILLAQLERLDEQVSLRLHNARLLDSLLSGMPGIRVLRNDPRSDRRSYHLYCLRYIKEECLGLPRAVFLDAVQAEGIPLFPGYPHPLYRNPMFRRRCGGRDDDTLSFQHSECDVDDESTTCPVCETVCEEAVWCSQSVLLGSEEDMRDVARGIGKVVSNAEELVGRAQVQETPPDRFPA